MYNQASVEYVSISMFANCISNCVTVHILYLFITHYLMFLLLEVCESFLCDKAISSLSTILNEVNPLYDNSFNPTLVGDQ